ncbi:helix-turn-helix transcriptional regulator [Streptomyces sp. BE308]|uniref:helix-turn-helix domain-containing protein n=1 Tax=Streptomyces sp. BE308 TaxID=3002529 RepID=UPI002E7A1881|nr:helix-turn-helix transcriptional regulator [Streptomyces sp. BE308]MEE1792601.1 helix-turn-helix transcriptional regulator [Streptomyces sp. BE308]
MAKLTGHEFTASALSRGASGRAIPTRRLVLAFAAACDADPEEAVRLWKTARRAKEERRRRAGISPEFQDLANTLRSALAHPSVVDSFGKLHGVMVEMRARHGQPSLSELQAAAGCTSDGRHRLPKSSLSVILRGEAVPSREHLTAFMEALDVSPSGVRRWQQVWDRISGNAARMPPTTIAEVTDALSGESSAGHHPAFTPADPRLAAGPKFLRIPLTMWFSSGPSGLRGPQVARAPAGTTRSGLPVRTPRRYTIAYPNSRSPIVGTITLQPRDVVSDLLDLFADTESFRPNAAVQAQFAAGAAAQDLPPRPREASSYRRRTFVKGPRRDHTRWPNF